MADQTVRVTNLPDSGSPARVAYDLAMRIAAQENYGKSGATPNARAYYLELFKACRNVVY